MWSFEDQRDYFTSMAQTANAAHITLGDKNINMGNKKLEVAMGMPPMMEERTYSTLTSTNSYPLPERFINMDQLYVTDSSGNRYYADPEYSEDAWRRYMSRTGNTGDRLSNVFVRPGIQRFEVFPTFATASLTMTMIYSAFTKDLTQADYTTGTITTLANGGTAVTGSGTTFTADMVGRWIKINSEGNWYKISGYTSATAITLLMPYQGTAISGGSESFTIGELPRTPEGTHEIAVHYALWLHFLGVKRDIPTATRYEKMWLEGKAWATEAFSNRYASAVIPSQRRKAMMGVQDPNNPPDFTSLH